MRSNHSPYPQHDQNEFNKILGALAVIQEQYAKECERLAGATASQIEPLLRHHTARRLIAKNSIADIKLEIKRAYQDLIQSIDRSWSNAMADIEVHRAEFHTQQTLERQRMNREKEEYASLTIDEGSDTYFYIKQVEVTDSSGRVTIEKRKTYITKDHQWVRNVLARK